MAAVQLVGAVGRDQQDPFLAQVPGEEAQQVTGGLVGPMDVLDDQDGGRPPPEPVEDAEEQFEEPARLVYGRGAVFEVAELGHEAAELLGRGPSSSSNVASSSSPWRRRSASITGPNGRVPSPRSTQPPVRTRWPSAMARSSSSRTRRVLPTPASPPTSTTCAVPPCAADSAERSWDSSSSRPTRVGLVSRRAMTAIMPPRLPSSGAET